MSMHIEKRGPDVTRDQLSQVCAVLGYDPADVKQIQLSGRSPVLVDVFLRAPMPGFERGMRVSGNGELSPYVTARITHDITSTASDEPAEDDEQEQPPISDERLALIDARAQHSDIAMTYVEVRELTDEIRRLKESR